jgi:TIR domain-containing protein
MPVKVFFCYAHEDEPLLKKLKTHLKPLQRQGLIDIWYDRDISAGTEWEREISKQLNTAQIILLLISPDFMNSDYCYSIEMKRALERHENSEARIIPVILRHVYWQGVLGKLQALPTDGKPVTDPDWRTQDRALYNVSEGIQKVIGSLEGSPDISIKQSRDNFLLYDVFVKSGVPGVTFVEREDFGRLKLSLAQPGRGVVIEGPSGVGKTTSLKKAIEELTSSFYPSGRTSGIGSSLHVLSARNPEHRNRLETLPNWHYGTVVIDDFHRLDSSLCLELVDYLKYLADTELESKKMVIVGIPQSGQTLVDISFDVATRIDVFKWGKVKDELILQMIEQGENALNIKFDRKTEIVSATSGSLNVAQFLC